MSDITYKIHLAYPVPNCFVTLFSSLASNGWAGSECAFERLVRCWAYAVVSGL